MTDEELIARLRLYGSKFHHEFGHNDAAADRIEALLEQCEGLAQVVDYNWVKHQRVIAAEAKLAKAVKALRFYAWENEMRLPSDGPWGAGSTDFGKVARATLAEIKGESHE
jgi:hypothetical protein